MKLIKDNKSLIAAKKQLEGKITEMTADPVRTELIELRIKSAAQASLLEDKIIKQQMLIETLEKPVEKKQPNAIA